MSEGKASTEHIDTMSLPTEQELKITSRTVLCAAGALVAIMATVFGVSATGTYAGAIAAHVNAPADAAWLSNSAQIVQVIIGPPIALSADIFGRRWFMIVGMTLGFIGAMVTASAHNGSIAILGAVITGMGFSTQALYLAILSEIMPRSVRPIMSAIFNVISAIGGIVGILVGGLALRNGVSVSWIYYVMGILYAIAAVSIAAMYRPAQRRPDTSSVVHQKRLKAIDVPGAVFLLFFACLFYFGLVSAKNPYPWKSSTILAPLIVSIAVFISFIIYEWQFTSEGLLHHALFKQSRNYAICLGLVFLEGIMFFSFNSQWAREVSLTQGMSGSSSGLLFLFFWVPSCIATPLVGYFAKRYKEVKISISGGFAFFLAAAVGMATATPGSRVAVRVYAALAGIGFSAPLTLVSAAAQLAAPPPLMAIASVNLLVLRALGGVVSVSVYSAVLKSKLASQLVPALERIQGLPASSLKAVAAASGLAQPQFGEALAKINGLSEPLRQEIETTVREVYSKSYRWVWVIAAPFALVAIVLTYCLEPVAPMMTAHVDAPAERATQPDVEENESGKM